MRKATFIVISFMLILLMGGTALAMSSASYNLPWTVLSGGGGDRSSSSYVLGDTVGQPSAIGPSESTNYRLGSGFWYGVSVTVTEGTCGDVNDDDNVNMADVMILWYDIAEYPSAGAWTISNEWAADVNCDEVINMADVMILWYDIADYPSAGAWEVACCE
jgi:hypothetical protein